MLDEQPTGVGVYTYHLINNLFRLYGKDRANTLTVFTPTRTLLSKDLTVVKLSTLLQSSKYGKLAAFCRFCWNTFLYPFQARGFDLLVSPTTHGSFLLKNQVITVHDLLSLRYKNISAHQRFYFKYLLPFLISRARLVIAVSETTKKDIVRFLKCPEEKIRVIHNGYDPACYHPSPANKGLIQQAFGYSNYLLAVGPTYPHKNIEILIHAYEALDKETRKNHPLLIAGGKKAYTDQLKERVEAAGLSEDVHFPGYVPASLMPALYQEARALFFPSLYEGFGIPLLEAMACGCPVVVSDTSSMPEVCGDAALYFDPRDQYSITAAMRRILSDEELRNDLREKGLARAGQFSWEKTAIAVKSLLDSHFYNINPKQ